MPNAILCTLLGLVAIAASLPVFWAIGWLVMQAFPSFAEDDPRRFEVVMLGVITIVVTTFFVIAGYSLGCWLRTEWWRHL